MPQRKLGVLTEAEMNRVLHVLVEPFSI